METDSFRLTLQNIFLPYLDLSLETEENCQLGCQHGNCLVNLSTFIGYFPAHFCVFALSAKSILKEAARNRDDPYAFSGDATAFIPGSYRKEELPSKERSH